MPATSADLHGKVCLVTGASSGIGKEAAVELAGKGARVVAVSRDRARGEAAVDDIRTRSGSREVDLVLADLSLLREVRKVAAEFLAQHQRLDVLVLNAGRAAGARRVTDEGFEETIALNHLGGFLLVRLLLDRLKASTPSRIVVVASEAHRQGRIRLDDLNLERGFSTYSAYGQSKLANVLMTFELARRLEGTGVTANCLHPGVVATGIWASSGTAATWIGRLAGPFMLSPAKGAETLVHLASSPEVAGVTGRYFIRKTPRRPSREAQDPELARKLWDATETLVARADETPLPAA